MEQVTKIGIGDFATCQRGELGLILWEHPQKDKRTNRPYILYHGINLSPGKVGKNWQSKSPAKVTKSQAKRLIKSKPSL